MTQERRKKLGRLDGRRGRFRLAAAVSGSNVEMLVLLLAVFDRL